MYVDYICFYCVAHNYFAHNGICANVSCAHYFAHVGFAPSCLPYKEYMQCTTNRRKYLCIRCKWLLVLCPVHVEGLDGRLHGGHELHRVFHRWVIHDARVLQRRRGRFRRKTLLCLRSATINTLRASRDSSEKDSWKWDI